MNHAISNLSIQTLRNESETESTPPTRRIFGADPGGGKPTMFTLNRTASPPGGSRRQWEFANRFRRTTRATRSAVTVLADGASGPHDSTMPTSEVADTPARRHEHILQRLVTIFAEDQAREIPIHHLHQTSTKE